MLKHVNDIFKSIDIYNPDLWIWLGDAAYTDHLAGAVCNILKSLINVFIDKDDNSMPE
jgi:hypothetical protein